MVTFTREEIEERKLESEIMKNPEAVEKGLRVLDHQVPAGRGKIDVICVDSGGTLCVMELKVVEDDTMLLQVLEYLDWTTNNLTDIAMRYEERFPKVKINKDENPRVMLIAPSFSETLLKSAKYVDPAPDLFEYNFLKSPSGERGLYCRPINIEPSKEPYAPPEVKDHLDYIINIPVRKFCKELVNRIKEIDDDIEVKALKWAIALKYQGRVLAYIDTKRSFFYLQYPKNPKGSKWEWVDIQKKSDFKSEMLEGIKDYYSTLRGE